STAPTRQSELFLLPLDSIRRRRIAVHRERNALGRTQRHRTLIRNGLEVELEVAAVDRRARLAPRLLRQPAGCRLRIDVAPPDDVGVGLREASHVLGRLVAVL